MRILICDDNSILTEQLNKYILEYFKKKKYSKPEISLFYNGEDLLKDSGEKDIVFLDIEMPGINGIYTGKTLKTQNKNVIIFIVTSYMEYLDEAMRFHVFRYLTKPVDKQRLFHNMNDALTLYRTFESKILIEEKSSSYAILSSDIILIETENHKTIVHTAAKDYYSIESLQFWVNSLKQPCFFQCNRSFIVNLQYITDFDHVQIHLANGKYTASLTSRKYSAFKEAYLFYLESLR